MENVSSPAGSSRSCCRALIGQLSDSRRPFHHQRHPTGMRSVQGSPPRSAASSGRPCPGQSTALRRFPRSSSLPAHQHHPRSLRRPHRLVPRSPFPRLGVPALLVQARADPEDSCVRVRKRTNAHNTGPAEASSSSRSATTKLNRCGNARQ